MVASPAQAGKCGAENQRACKVWERVPSCDKGLTEAVRPGYCKKPPEIGKPVFNCGALRQKPCPVVVRVPSCDKGLVEDFIRNRCVKKSNADSLVNLGKACFETYKNVAIAMVPAVNCIRGLRTADDIVKSLKRKDVNSAVEYLVYGSCKRKVEHAAAVARQNGFVSISLGIGGEVAAVIGANSEFFLAVNTNLQGRAHIYETLGYRFGAILGGSVNGIVTAHRGNASSLAGDGQGVSLSLKALKGNGFSSGFSFANGSQSPNCTSLSVAAGAGAEANAGSVDRFTTIRLTK